MEPVPAALADWEEKILSGAWSESLPGMADLEAKVDPEPADPCVSKVCDR
jgi:hypothetical protein